MSWTIICVCIGGFLHFVNGSPPPVYVSNGTHVLSYTRDKPQVDVIIGQAGYRIVGLAVDLGRDLMFWSDTSKEFSGIYTSDLDGNNATIIVKDVGEVNGLSVDWVSRHVYWTDLDRGTVEVANYQGTSRKILVSTDLKTPQAIIADPIVGFLFWVNHNPQRIERSLLDGSNRRTIYKSSVIWPNQLAISHKTKLLYWVDSKAHAIWSIQLNGKDAKKQVNYRKVAQRSPGFGLIVYGNTAVVSTWFNTAIYSMLLESKRLVWQQETKGLGTRELYNLVSLNRATQPMTYHPCMDDDRAGCSDLCLPSGRKSQFKCTCPTYGGVAMYTDRCSQTPDTNTCRVPCEVLLFTSEDNGDVGFISPDTSVAHDVHLISKSTSPAAVTYDPFEKIVYWSDAAENRIYNARLDGTEKLVFLDSNKGVGLITGMAFHLRTACLYFTNVGQSVQDGTVYRWHRVEMISVHSGDRMVILQDLEKPVSVAVDEEYLYVLDAGRSPRILQTELDGGRPRALPNLAMDSPFGLGVSAGILSVADSRDSSNSSTMILLDYSLEMHMALNATVIAWKMHKANQDVVRKDNGGWDIVNVTASTKQSNQSTKVSLAKLGTAQGFARVQNGAFFTDTEHGEIVAFNGTSAYPVLTERKPTSLQYTLTSVAVDKQHDHISDCIAFGCSHGCVPLPRGSVEPYRCTCPDHLPMVLSRDNRTCKRPENFLLYSDVTTLNLLSLDAATSGRHVTLVYGDSPSNLAGLNYDPVKDRIYWLDNTRNAIYLSNLHTLEPVLLYKETGTVDSLVIDSVRQRIYWTGTQLGDRDAGYLASLNLRGLDTYKRLLSSRNRPKSLTLHPNGKWLYWVESIPGILGAKILTCKNNGHRFREVISSGIYWPNSILVTKDKIYIAESSGKIMSADLNGQNIEEVFSTDTNIYGLQIQGDLLFFSDWQTSAIYMLHLDTQSSVAVATNITQPTSLVLHHPGNVSAVCEFGEGRLCSDICIPLAGGHYNCRCYDDLPLLEDDKTCEKATTTAVPTTTTTQTTTTTTQTTATQPTTARPTAATTTIPTTKPTTTTQPSIPFVDFYPTTTKQPSTTTDKTELYPDVEVAYYETDNSEDEYEEIYKDYYERGDKGEDLVSIDITDSPTTQAHQHQTTVHDLTTAKHYAEPKPTPSTRKQSVEVNVAPTAESREPDYSAENREPAYTEDTDGHVRVEPLNMPRFDHCPSGETIYAKLPKGGNTIELGILPTGFDSRGNELPLHSNYEMTLHGLLIQWKGKGTESRHHVMFKVTDSNMMEAACEFDVVLQDVEAPVFTYCPQNIKVGTAVASENVSWDDPEAVDNIGIRLISGSYADNRHFPAGESLVNYTAEDYAGNKAFCTFRVTVIHDKLCNLPWINHGGIVCLHGDKTDGDCSVICETGYVVNPIRTFRRTFNCQHPDDIDALTSLMNTQKPCLSKRYPSVIQQEFRLLFHGPITQHQEEVITFLSVAISEHLEKKKLCSQQVCQIGNLTVPCDPSRDPGSNPGSEVNNNSCFEDIESEKFFITFNVTLKNTTSPAELDMGKLLQEIQRELLSLTSLLQLQLEDHLFTAITDSLSTNEITWSCPLGQIPETNICIACPPGTMHNVTLDICQYCNMGQFQEKEGQVTCDYCGPGKTSPGGATTSTQCHTIPSMDEMTLFVIVTACSFGVVFLCMAITLYLQFQRQQKRNQKASSQKKTRYNMTPNIYVAPPPILKSKLDENLSPGQRTYSIDKKHPINIYNNHDYEDPDRSPMSAPTSVFQNEMFNGSPGQVRRATNRDYSPMEEVPTGTLSRENTFNNSTYSPLFSVKRTERGSQKGSPIPQRKMSHDSSFSSYSPGMMRTQGTPTSDTPLITQSPLLRLKLAAYNLNQED